MTCHAKPSPGGAGEGKLAGPRASVPASRRGGTRLHAFDDADLADGAVAEGRHGLLVRGAVVRGDRLRNALELDDDGALLQAMFVDGDRLATGEERAAAAGDGGAGQLGVRRQLVGVGDGAIGAHPVSLCQREILLGVVGSKCVPTVPRGAVARPAVNKRNGPSATTLDIGGGL
jgi:hypothetical protein